MRHRWRVESVECSRCRKPGVRKVRDDVLEAPPWFCHVCVMYLKQAQHLKQMVEHFTLCHPDDRRRRVWEYRLEVLRRLNPKGAESYHSYAEDANALAGFLPEEET